MAGLRHVRGLDGPARPTGGVERFLEPDVHDLSADRVVAAHRGLDDDEWEPVGLDRDDVRLGRELRVLGIGVLEPGRELIGVRQEGR